MDSNFTTHLINIASARTSWSLCSNADQVATKIIEHYTEDENLNLHHKFASFFYYLNIFNKNYAKLDAYARNSYNPNTGFVQESFYNNLVLYFVSLDSCLDTLSKGSDFLELKSGLKYNRYKNDFDSIVNDVRNFILHDGLPYIEVNRSDNYVASSSCCDIAYTHAQPVQFHMVITVYSNKIDRIDLTLPQILSFHSMAISSFEDFFSKACNEMQ